MSLFRSIQQFFSNHFETGEREENPMLRTHYYKATTSNALKIIQEQLANMPGFKITSVSSEHGEISVEVTSPKRAFIVVSVVSVRPLETAVDFSVTSESAFSFGYSRVIIGKLYKVLNEKLVHIGKGNAIAGNK
ncbi:cytosolic protein [Bacillus sp. DJP31]|uniref:cytosolic protein n=1 Tax=Bacillus sp. DJP31 TaxID=3409789 RepID=UPI003BB52056